jgi:hypothetical protein
VWTKIRAPCRPVARTRKHPRQASSANPQELADENRKLSSFLAEHKASTEKASRPAHAVLRAVLRPECVRGTPAHHVAACPSHKPALTAAAVAAGGREHGAAQRRQPAGGRTPRHPRRHAAHRRRARGAGPARAFRRAPTCLVGPALASRPVSCHSEKARLDTGVGSPSAPQVFKSSVRGVAVARSVCSNDDALTLAGATTASVDGACTGERRAEVGGTLAATPLAPLTPHPRSGTVRQAVVPAPSVQRKPAGACVSSSRQV